MNSSNTSRRRFLHTVAGAASGVHLVNISTSKVGAQIIGANERVRIGVCGIRGRGSSHIDGYMTQDNVEVTTLIDVDETQFAARQRQIRDKTGREATNTVNDIRRALDDKDLDAVSIATCNHTHSLNAIFACQAGKDVYVEKPMSHEVWEGRKVIEAAAKYGRIVQHGTQQRSTESRAKEIAAVKSGNYGKLLVSKGYCCKPRWSIGFKEPKDPPTTFNWDAWLGPAPMQPYHENLVHYNWHWFWDFGNGDTGNQGVHEIDVARWAIDGATMPTKVWALGGRLGYEDQGQTPNMHLSVFEYGDVLLVFETRGLVDKHENFPRKVLNEYYTTDGVIRGGKFYPTGSEKGEDVKGGTPDPITPGGPFQSFITSVRARDPKLCNAGPEHGHFSSALCHLGNIAYRVGSTTPFEGDRPKRLGDDPRVAEAFDTIKGNLSAAGVNLAATQYQLSPVLDFDPVTERFPGEGEAIAKANALLKREYRKPWVIPDAV
ncbi:MAG: Gfo/Idh/MocA family oxidoreductase [Verrucomicrobiae bacterium]|nr:Gfo/Idh/MocA family oxidoreductase [Verrucomicrobiae bacterium]